MFECTVCKRITYKREAYCECGNDTFVEIVQNQNSGHEVKKITVGQLMSYVIFLVCLILAVLIWVE